MNILVCVHALKGESGTGPFRSSALDGAIQAAERIPGVQITAVAMQDFGGTERLRSSLALAADEAILLQGPDASAYDSAALGRMLSEAVRRMEQEKGPVDAVFCGDSDPGQDGLGPALAGCLGWPQITGVRKVEADGESLKVWRSWEDEYALLRVGTPCVLSFLPSDAPPGYPQIARLMAANQVEIPSYGMTAAPNIQQLLAFSPRPRQRWITLRATQEDTELLARLLADEYMI
ncbi:hypothetical protein [Pseudoflavonifractor capillosus]|uniref:Electron transfer flavoprotein small subunit n=1 Tax=Pseudoflavonifractor capillosus TaxID=106588 RepID=A0A921MJ48_9FIRM|nr:hypothetical protein [Pseudoflavonifractor capillosus]HJG85518.1 hypothetical protein [Pseudoflavonifractor capillosus]